MEENSTFEAGYLAELFTDNSALHHYSQCKNCVFRDKPFIDGEEYGYDKCVCRIYGKRTALTTNNSNGKPFFPYTPIEMEDKPQGVYDNTKKYDYYEKE